MSGLRGSANYIWFESDVLGQGATGAVYKARHKRTGELQAVKTFNHMGQMRPMDVQMREFQVLQKVKHENIVKLLAIEEETAHNNKVIIMELCTGGSLYNLLEESRNSLGLNEKEVFLVLGDVASGLKHLRELGIVHRDIKPGNIMLFKSEDGRNVYKLTDFGAARELEDEEQFMSLYGTEEYLFPDMYARAVLRRPSDRQFDASVDLWSLGVTLYHVATGQLPYRPFGGRANKHTMYEMTTRKDIGIISGVQHTAGGEIVYSRELPSTCQLSLGAKLLITPLLAGLMECKEDRIWSFDKFFHEVNIILKKQKLCVFSTFRGKLLHVYLDPTDKVLQLQEAIAVQTAIPASHQELIQDHNFLSKHVEHMTEVRKYPHTSPTNPILLFYKNDFTDGREFPKFENPEIPKTSASNGQASNLQADYLQAKTTAGVLHHIKRGIDKLHQEQSLISMAARVFLFILCTNLQRLQTHAHQFSLVVEEMQKRLHLFTAQHERNVAMASKSDTQTSPLTRTADEVRNEGERFLKETKGKLSDLSEGSKEVRSRVDEFYTRVLTTGELSCDHVSERQCKDNQRCHDKVNLLLTEVEETIKNFRTDKKKRNLSHNEEQIHKFERHKLKVNCDKASNVLLTSCAAGTKSIFKNFVDWFKWSSEVRRQLKEVEEHMVNLTRAQEDLSPKMDACQKKYFDRMDGRMSHGACSHNDVMRDIETEYVMYNKEDAPPLGKDPKHTTSSGHNRKTLRNLNGQLVSLKADTRDIKNYLNANTGLLQQIQGMVEKS